MIPIFPFFSLSLAVGLLGILFPGLFPAAGNMIRCGGFAALGTYRRGRNATQDAIIYSTAALTIWFGLLALAIYLRRWEFAIVGMVSTGLAFLAAATLMLTAKAVTTGLARHIKARSTAWSSAIKLRNVPWNLQSWHMQLIMLLLSPFYGLYLLLALPAKAVLEIAAASADFVVQDLAKWMQQIVVILAAVSVCAWFLSGLIVFQLQFNLNGPLDMFTLLMSLMFVATLIALLLMVGSPMVKVLEFIQLLGFVNLAMIGFTVLAHFRSDLCDPLLRTFTDRWSGLVNNVNTNPGLAMIMMVALSALVCTMPWCRPFAGPISLGLLALWVLSTDYGGPFYSSIGWWIGLLGLAACWLFLRSWKLPLTSLGTSSPASPRTPSPFNIQPLIAVAVTVIAFAAVGLMVLFMTGNASGLRFTGTHGSILLATLGVAGIVGWFGTRKG